MKELFKCKSNVHDDNNMDFVHAMIDISKQELAEEKL